MNKNNSSNKPQNVNLMVFNMITAPSMIVNVL